jgi:hypothetical protein
MLLLCFQNDQSAVETVEAPEQVKPLTLGRAPYPLVQGRNRFQTPFLSPLAPPFGSFLQYDSLRGPPMFFSIHPFYHYGELTVTVIRNCDGTGKSWRSGIGHRLRLNETRAFLHPNQVSFPQSPTNRVWLSRRDQAEVQPYANDLTCPWTYSKTNGIYPALKCRVFAARGMG